MDHSHDTKRKEYPLPTTVATTIHILQQIARQEQKKVKGMRTGSLRGAPDVEGENLYITDRNSDILRAGIKVTPTESSWLAFVAGRAVEPSKSNGAVLAFNYNWPSLARGCCTAMA